MGTTNLFVELVVIGAGVLIWLALFMLTVLGLPSVAISESFQVAFTIPMLAIIYVAGIIWDRIADLLFEKSWVDRWRLEFFQNKKDYYNARRTILTKSERLSDLLEYGRSRMRICRAWTLNSILIGIFFSAFIYRNFPHDEKYGLLILTAIFLSLIFSFGAWYAWASMTKTQFRKVKEQSNYLQLVPKSS